MPVCSVKHSKLVNIQFENKTQSNNCGVCLFNCLENCKTCRKKCTGQTVHRFFCKISVQNILLTLISTW